MKAIQVTRQPLSADEIGQVRTMMASQGYRLLLEIMSAHRAESLASYMDASLFYTEGAESQQYVHKHRAMKFNAALEVLDELAMTVDWFRITLEQGR